MTFMPIDMESWPRAGHFLHYMQAARCSHSTTVQVDITTLRTALRARKLKAYPALIHMLATVVNRMPEFRMGLDVTGQPGYWDVVHPMYTVLNRETETFSAIWSQYDTSFAQFYRNCTDDIAKYATGAFMPQDEVPPNVFDISSMPWVDFTGFNINLHTEGTHLLPIFTMGKYVEAEGRTLMPLAIQVHHAACDGLHVGRFVEAVQVLVADCAQWL